MKVLIACEYSGVVRNEFLSLGHYAVSCDLLPTDIPGFHYKGDVRELLDDDWDLMIAHPPCTYLCNSGVRWLHSDPERWALMRDGSELFKTLLNSNIPKIAIENPIMHKYAKDIIGRGQDQLIQPWQFGHPEKKATCLWLKGLPKLEPTNNVKKHMDTLSKQEQQRLFYLPPSEDRWKIRSTTYSGIAKAMAEQWGQK